jgi:hypothetical protein
MLSGATCLVDLQIEGGSVTFTSENILIEYDMHGNLCIADYAGHMLWFAAENIIDEQASPDENIFKMANNTTLTITRQWVA